MMRAFLLFLILATFNAIDANAGAIGARFSLDPASPSTSSNITPADALLPGPAVDIPGRTLGLQENFPSGAFDSLADFSFGRDAVHGPLYFSVDRVSVGLSGTAVFAEAQPGVGSAAGDVFQALPRFGSNSLFIRGTQLGLQPGFFGDDLDGLDLNATPSPNTYFAIGRLSATNGFGTGKLASDILVSAGNGQFSVYATNTIMGLQPGDGIDGLALWDQNLDQVPDPATDMALFSVDPFSPDTFTDTGLNYIPCVPGHMSPADVCFTNFMGSFSLWASAETLGLRPDDNVDALATTISEPGSLILLGAALLSFHICRRRRRASGVFERGMLAISGNRPPHQPAKVSYQQFIYSIVLLVSLALPLAAIAQNQDAFSGGQVFFGISPARPDSKGILFLEADVRSNSNFGWQSADPILGNINTGSIHATTWSVYGAEPARVVFTGTGDGATIHGDMLLAPYDQGVIDVVRGSQHLRYLVNFPCGPDEDPYACDVRIWSCKAEGASSSPSDCPFPSLFTGDELNCPRDGDTSCFANEGEVQDSSSALAFNVPRDYNPAITDDISRLIDDQFRTSVDKVDCKNVFTPYFPGIQADDDTDLMGKETQHARLAGDAPVAALYFDHALQGARGGQHIPWGLLSYYNQWDPALITRHGGGDPAPNPTVVFPAVAGQNPVKLLYRANHATDRFATRKQGQVLGRDSPNGPANGDVVKWGDQLETRMLGIWTSASTNDKFKEHRPEFTAILEGQKARDTADFDKYFSNVANTKAWKDFMYLASFEVASAFKCGRRVFAHSGGGAVIGFVMRLLDADPGMQIRLKMWPLDATGKSIKGIFVVIGSEAVLSEEVITLLNSLESYKINEKSGRAVVLNFVAKSLLGVRLPNGSPTWEKVIVPEIESVGQVALNTQGIAWGPLKDIKGLPNIKGIGDFFLHSRIGFYVLINGGLPAQLGAAVILPDPLGILPSP